MRGSGRWSRSPEWSRALVFSRLASWICPPCGAALSGQIRARWARCVATAITLPPRKGRVIAAAALLRGDQAWALGVYEALAWVHDRRRFPEPFGGVGSPVSLRQQSPTHRLAARVGLVTQSELSRSSHHASPSHDRDRRNGRCCCDRRDVERDVAPHHNRLARTKAHSLVRISIDRFRCGGDRRLPEPGGSVSGPSRRSGKRGRASVESTRTHTQDVRVGRARPPLGWWRHFLLGRKGETAASCLLQATAAISTTTSPHGRTGDQATRVYIDGRPRYRISAVIPVNSLDNEVYAGIWEVEPIGTHVGP